VRRSSFWIRHPLREHGCANESIHRRVNLSSQSICNICSTYNYDCSTGGLWMKGALVGKVCRYIHFSQAFESINDFLAPHAVDAALRSFCVERHAGRRPGTATLVYSHFCSAASIHVTALQEAAIFGALANFTHHGMIYVPIGYRFAASSLACGIGACLSRRVVQCTSLLIPHSTCTAAWRSSLTCKRFMAPVHGVQVQARPILFVDLIRPHIPDSCQRS
jgi:hypothetical protein